MNKRPSQAWINALIYVVRFAEQQTGADFIHIIEEATDEIYHSDDELNDRSLTHYFLELFNDKKV